LEYKPTQLNIGLKTAEILVFNNPKHRTKSIKLFALRKKGCWLVNGYTRTPFNHLLANYKGDKQQSIIKIYALAGKLSTIFIYITVGTILSIVCCVTIKSTAGLIVLMCTILPIVLETLMFLLITSDTNDRAFFFNPQKFVEHFKNFKDDNYYL
jgi:hypothetical protein